MGNTWTQATFCQGAVIPPFGFTNQISILWAIANSNGADTIDMSATLPNGPEVFYAFEFSGIDPINPVDVASSDSGSTLVPTITTTQGHDLIITGLVLPAARLRPRRRRQL